MKTIKTIITALLLLFSVTSFAQTKEETIAWIKEKLEKHGGRKSFNHTGNYYNVQVSPCSISFVIKWDWGGEYNLVFNPSTAKSWEVTDDKEYIYADAEIIHSVYKKTGERGTSKYLEIKNGEADIHERMIKALLHLATFCEEGKNEAF